MRRRFKGLQRLSEIYGNAPESIETLPDEPRPFNEAIGLPRHPLTNLPSPLTSYQLSIISYPGKEIIVNKSNKIGITEAILRRMIMKAIVGDCKGYQLMLGAQALELAMENMRRLQQIFTNSDLLSKKIHGEPTAKRLMLTDGTTFFVMPRRAAMIRGWPRLKYAFLDEAAHYGLLDDEEFLAATYSRLANTQGYLDVVSTPRGQRGYFWRVYKAAVAGEISMKSFTYDCNAGLAAGLMTQEFIDDAKSRLGPLFPQEFECMFMSSQQAAVPESIIDSSLRDYEFDEL